MKYKYKLFYKCRMCKVIFEVNFESDRAEERHFPFLARHHGCADAEALSSEGSLVGMGDVVAIDQTPYLNLKRKENAEDN